MNTFEGNVVAKDVKIGIVTARFNEFIVYIKKREDNFN